MKETLEKHLNITKKREKKNIVKISPPQVPLSIPIKPQKTIAIIMPSSLGARHVVCPPGSSLGSTPAQKARPGDQEE